MTSTLLIGHLLKVKHLGGNTVDPERDNKQYPDQLGG